VWVRREAEGAFSVLMSQAERNMSIPARDSRSDLAAELGQSVCEVWRRVLSRTRYSEERNFGCDGVDYHFAYWARGIVMEGRTWSPPDGTVPGMLAALSQSLRDYVQNTGQANEPIMERIKQQAAWLLAHEELKKVK